jgi:hypothetical protein
MGSGLRVGRGASGGVAGDGDVIDEEALVGDLGAHAVSDEVLGALEEAEARVDAVRHVLGLLFVLLVLEELVRVLLVVLAATLLVLGLPVLRAEGGLGVGAGDGVDGGELGGGHDTRGPGTRGSGAGGRPGGSGGG